MEARGEVVHEDAERRGGRAAGGEGAEVEEDAAGGGGAGRGGEEMGSGGPDLGLARAGGSDVGILPLGATAVAAAGLGGGGGVGAAYIRRGLAWGGGKAARGGVPAVHGFGRRRRGGWAGSEPTAFLHRSWATRGRVCTIGCLAGRAGGADTTCLAAARCRQSAARLSGPASWRLEIMHDLNGRPF